MTRVFTATHQTVPESSCSAFGTFIWADSVRLNYTLTLVIAEVSYFSSMFISAKRVSYKTNVEYIYIYIYSNVIQTQAKTVRSRELSQLNCWVISRLASKLTLQHHAYFRLTYKQRRAYFPLWPIFTLSTQSIINMNTHRWFARGTKAQAIDERVPKTSAVFCLPLPLCVANVIAPTSGLMELWGDKYSVDVTKN